MAREDLDKLPVNGFRYEYGSLHAKTEQGAFSFTYDPRHPNFGSLQFYKVEKADDNSFLRSDELILTPISQGNGFTYVVEHRVTTKEMRKEKEAHILQMEKYAAKAREYNDEADQLQLLIKVDKANKALHQTNRKEVLKLAEQEIDKLNAMGKGPASALAYLNYVDINNKQVSSKIDLLKSQDAGGVYKFMNPPNIYGPKQDLQEYHNKQNIVLESLPMIMSQLAQNPKFKDHPETESMLRGILQNPNAAKEYDHMERAVESSRPLDDLRKKVLSEPAVERARLDRNEKKAAEIDQAKKNKKGGWKPSNIHNTEVDQSFKMGDGHKIFNVYKNEKGAIVGALVGFSNNGRERLYAFKENAFPEGSYDKAITSKDLHEKTALMIEFSPRPYTGDINELTPETIIRYTDAGAYRFHFRSRGVPYALELPYHKPRKGDIYRPGSNGSLLYMNMTGDQDYETTYLNPLIKKTLKNNPAIIPLSSVPVPFLPASREDLVNLSNELNKGNKPIIASKAIPPEDFMGISNRQNKAMIDFVATLGSPALYEDVCSLNIKFYDQNAGVEIRPNGSNFGMVPVKVLEKITNGNRAALNGLIQQKNDTGNILYRDGAVGTKVAEVVLNRQNI